VGICFAKRTMRGFERQRFLTGDWAMKAKDMTEDMRKALIAQTSVDEAHLRNEEEVETFVQMQQLFDSTGKQTDWYWQEDAHRKNNWSPDVIHPDPDLETRENKIWVKCKLEALLSLIDTLIACSNL
jgi:hypothetical protein